MWHNTQHFFRYSVGRYTHLSKYLFGTSCALMHPTSVSMSIRLYTYNSSNSSHEVNTSHEANATHSSEYNYSTDSSVKESRAESRDNSTELSISTYHNNNLGHSSVDSTNDDNYDQDVEEEFDELEAASQELHDLTEALKIYVYKLDPINNANVVERCSVKHINRVSPKNRIIREYDRCYREQKNPNNYYVSAEEFNEASKHYIDLFDKLLVLLTQPVFERMMMSAGKRFRDNRKDGIHLFRNNIAKHTWRAFPHIWFKHAPFEVQQLRADIPADTIANTRSYRDYDTINSLLKLTHRAHPYRGKLESQMEQLTSHYDKLRYPQA